VGVLVGGAGAVHGWKLTDTTVVPARLAMSLEANCTRSVLKLGSTKELTLLKTPV
jgi:hypothetical protein